jgi:hypothetical protein
VLGQTEAIASQDIVASGFLDNYEILKPDASIFGTYLYTSDDLKGGKYKKIILDPIEIWMDPQSHYKGVSMLKIMAMTDEMRKALTDSLSGAFEIVNEPGPDVMVIRLAITNVNARRPKKRVVINTPRGSGEVIKSVKNAAAVQYSLKKAVLEVEVFDAESFDTLINFMDIRLGLDSEGEVDDTRSWSDVNKDLEFYVERFVKSLQSAVGGK